MRRRSERPGLFDRFFTAPGWKRIPGGPDFCRRPAGNFRRRNGSRWMTKCLPRSRTPGTIRGSWRFSKSGNGPGRTWNLEKGRLLCFHDLQDPGNLGTIFRVLEAGGGAGLVLTFGSVDPYSPKVVRASAGSFFRLPFLISPSPGTILQELRSRGYRIWAAAASGHPSFWEVDFSKPTAFLLGQEGGGLPEEWRTQADGALTIPMASGIDSSERGHGGGLDRL